MKRGNQLPPAETGSPVETGSGPVFCAAFEEIRQRYEDTLRRYLHVVEEILAAPDTGDLIGVMFITDVTEERLLRTLAQLINR